MSEIAKCIRKELVGDMALEDAILEACQQQRPAGRSLIHIASGMITKDGQIAPSRVARTHVEMIFIKRPIED